jgi:hypothetical protein
MSDGSKKYEEALKGMKDKTPNIPEVLGLLKASMEGKRGQVSS